MKFSINPCRLLPKMTSALIAGLLSLVLMAPVQAAETVKTGYQPLLSFMALFAAIEKGYFKEQNIELEMIRFKSGSHMLPALAIGEIDVASGASGAPFYNAIGQKTGFKIVADKGRIRKGYSFTVLIVRKDLYDSGRVRSLKDIMGLKVGQFTNTSINAYIMSQVLAHAGMDYDKLKLVYLNPPKQFQALASKAIDAGMTVEPWAARAVAKGIGVYLKTVDDWLGDRDFQIAVIIYSGKFIKDKRDLAQRWMNAYLKGLKYHHSHGFQNDEELQIIGKWTKVPAKIVRKAIPAAFSLDGRVDIPTLEEAYNWYVKKGYIKEKISVRNAVDHSFIK